MSKYYDEALIPAELRRNFDVYDRIRALQLPLGSFETDVVSLANAGIAGAVIHESGLVYLSGTTGGTLPMWLESFPTPAPLPFACPSTRYVASVLGAQQSALMPTARELARRTGGVHPSPTAPPLTVETLRGFDSHRLG